MLPLPVSVLLFIVGKEALGGLEQLLAELTGQSFPAAAVTGHVDNWTTGIVKHYDFIHEKKSY